VSRLRSRSTTRRARGAAWGEKLRVPSGKTLRCCEKLAMQVEYTSARRERRRPGDAAAAIFSAGPSLSSSWCRPDGRDRVAARFTHHRAAPSRSRPAKDVTPWQCPWAFGAQPPTSQPSSRSPSNCHALPVPTTAIMRRGKGGGEVAPAGQQRLALPASALGLALKGWLGLGKHTAELRAALPCRLPTTCRLTDFARKVGRKAVGSTAYHRITRLLRPTLRAKSVKRHVVGKRHGKAARNSAMHRGGSRDAAGRCGAASQVATFLCVFGMFVWKPVVVVLGLAMGLGGCSGAVMIPADE